MKNVLLIALTAWFALSLLLTCNPEESSVVETRIDTVHVRDTIRDTVPKYIIRYVARVDSIAYYDTTRKDTVYIPIDIERVEYRKKSYFAIVEGYKPKLHYIETYSDTVFINRATTVTNTVKVKSRWGLGVHVGYGYALNGKFTPYIGVGVQYNILTW